MTIEQLKELTEIEDEERLNAIVAAFDQETQGLVRTKDTLRSQVKDLEKRIKNYDGLDPEKYAEMQEELEQLRDATRKQNDNGEGGNKTGDQELKAMEERLTKKYTEQLSRKDEDLRATKSELHSMLINIKMREAIEKVGVADEHRGLVFEAFRNRAAVDEIDGNRVVQIPTGDGLKLPPDEFFKDWASTDEGKRYIKARVNSGGDARGGSGGKDGPKVVKRSEWESMDQSERAKVAAEGYKITDG